MLRLFRWTQRLLDGLIAFDLPVRKTRRPTLTQVEAAARQLHVEGEFHHWWPESVTSYESIDPIGKEEFDAIVERVLMAAAKAR